MVRFHKTTFKNAQRERDREVEKVKKRGKERNRQKEKQIIAFSVLNYVYLFYD